MTWLMLFTSWRYSQNVSCVIVGVPIREETQHETGDAADDASGNRRVPRQQTASQPRNAPGIMPPMNP